jgi:hypothetical protein
MIVIHARLATAALAGMLVLGGVALSGCGNAVQGAVEEAAGKAIGGNVDISSDGLSVTSSGGNQVQIGADVAIPDNWPDAVPPFDGGKLTSVMIAGDGSQINAIWAVDGTADDAMKAYGAALESAGFTAGETVTAADMTSNDYTGNGYTVNVIAASADGQTTLMVNASKG